MGVSIVSQKQLYFHGNALHFRTCSCRFATMVMIWTITFMPSPQKSSISMNTTPSTPSSLYTFTPGQVRGVASTEIIKKEIELFKA